VKRTKKKRLTKAQKRLLQWPPTEKTWLCPKCDAPNNGKAKECSWCRTAKPKKPNLLWPQYVAACAIIDITPGTKVRFDESGNLMFWTGRVYRYPDQEVEEQSTTPKKVRRK